MHDVRTLERVFTRHLLDEIARADRRVGPDEQAVVERICPAGPLREKGLLDAEGRPTAAFGQARAEALNRLPAQLTLERKLAIVTGLVELSVVDGHLDRAEGSLVFLAAQLLGVSAGEFDRHLDSLAQVGNVELE